MGLLAYMYTFYTQFSLAKGAGQRSWSLYSSVVMLITSFMKWKDSPPSSMVKMPQLKWVILFALNMLIISLFAADPQAHKQDSIQFFKIAILYFLIVKIVNTKKKYKYFMWLQLWGNLHWAYRAKTVGKTIQGRLEGIGGPRTNTSNTLSSHILLFFPVLGNLMLIGNIWEKIFGIISLPLVGNMYVQCNSRGAFLGGGAMAVLTLAFAHKKVRLKMLIGMLLCVLCVYIFAFEKVTARLETMENYEEDGSAMGRVDAWIGALKLIKRYPLGIGGGGFKYYSPEVIPEIVAAHGGQPRSVHSTYFEIATNFGIQGLSIFLMLILHTLYELYKIRKRSGTYDDIFYKTESTAIGIGLVGFLISAIFGVRIYAENMYWYLALSTALSNIQKVEILERQKSLAKEKGDHPDHVN
jgi:probable O-glycosylation ligase (exosortase A-associated)